MIYARKAGSALAEERVPGAPASCRLAAISGNAPGTQALYEMNAFGKSKSGSV